MSKIRYVAQETVKVKDAETSKLLATLFWGDNVELVKSTEEGHQIRIFCRNRVTGKWKWNQGIMPAKTKLSDSNPVLKVRFIDVGQGDGAIVETPSGRLIIIDGGEGNNFSRYVTTAFMHVIMNEPLPCDAIVVTHGDADHFVGLTNLLEQRRHDKEGNQLEDSPFVLPQRIFHNGLVKRPDPEKVVDAFGETEVVDKVTYCTELADDLLAVAEEELSETFKRWHKALADLPNANDGLEITRLEYGQDARFDFLKDEGIGIKVLGPITDQVNNAPALRFLLKPGSKSSLSDSHTVNGHSIVLKLTYGNVRFLFGADLNEESEERLLKKAGEDGISLAAEILKVPHHGSHEFNPHILDAIRPVVSVVSSGDENAMKEYIHPRAGLMGALGKYSRHTVDKPLIFVTEMVAFFAQVNQAYRKRKPSEVKEGESEYEELRNVYQKSQYGIVHVRTDGEKVLVITHSGKEAMKEYYTFTVDEHGDVTFD